MFKYFVFRKSNTMFMYMCDNRLRDHTNADLCTDGKSGVSHDISCLRTVLYIVSVNYHWARYKKLSFGRLHQYFKNLHGQQLRPCTCTMTALFPGKSPRT